jgi:membrane-bound lytic murein transglycosylase D
MPKTARDYGLEVSVHRDERTDPEKSTYAAAAYFKDLIAIFGSKSSVMLCMAAYNAGETRIINALKRINDPVNDRDFWYLYKKKWLAEETNEYIPQILALIIISEHMEEYGFE